MNRTDLQAIRQLLFFTQAEAARHVASTPECPDGVTPDTWQAWEAGTQPIPPHIVERITDLSEWRYGALAATADNVRIQIGEQDGAPDSVFVIWYDNLDDWLSMPGREPVMWRLQQSVCAGLREMYSIVKLVCFDADAYRQWRGERVDSESLRAEWASTVA
ncbi:DUF1870 family protein [uncultured Propionivibrio sp.]|uniref:Aca2/YdiL-like domain-containing protein n=1 Tax=uncultured Propionivibrio sp. TaxID=426737 RepID=UPI0029C0B401|nr:DUF1870 family protein [uncultured Propionivibrio sp.]